MGTDGAICGEISLALRQELLVAFQGAGRLPGSPPLASGLSRACCRQGRDPSARQESHEEEGGPEGGALGRGKHPREAPARLWGLPRKSQGAVAPGPGGGMSADTACGLLGIPRGVSVAQRGQAEAGTVTHTALLPFILPLPPLFGIPSPPPRSSL